MRVRTSYNGAGGTLKAIASKSVAHRLLICSAFADRQTKIFCEETNDDISATADCLSSLGANIVRDGAYYIVDPIRTIKQNAVLNCNESGSTLRFLLPVACMVGANASFFMSGRLPERPLSPLREELERCGIRLSKSGTNPLMSSGKINETSFSIAGNISSQFISGLILALSVSGKDGEVKILGHLESSPYIDLTVDALNVFGVKVSRSGDVFQVNGSTGLRSPEIIYTEGDWSGAAFPLSMGAIGKSPVTVMGLNPDSHQGDKRIISILKDFGAKIKWNCNSVTIFPTKLKGIDIDASEIPDLVPVLATVASVADGKTRIYNASRLRIKESDRLKTTAEMLNALGAKITELSDGLEICGVDCLVGGSVSSFGDHRIAMSAAVAAVAAKREVTIDRAEAAAKSYPSFWNDIKALGFIITEE